MGSCARSMSLFRPRRRRSSPSADQPHCPTRTVFPLSTRSPRALETPVPVDQPAPPPKKKKIKPRPPSGTAAAARGRTGRQPPPARARAVVAVGRRPPPPLRTAAPAHGRFAQRSWPTCLPSPGSFARRRRRPRPVAATEAASNLRQAAEAAGGRRSAPRGERGATAAPRAHATPQPATAAGVRVRGPGHGTGGARPVGCAGLWRDLECPAGVTSESDGADADLGRSLQARRSTAVHPALSPVRGSTTPARRQRPTP